MTHAATAKYQQSANPTSTTRPGRRTGAQAKRRSVAQEPLSFMTSNRGAKTYWTSAESVPGYYPEIDDADVRAWHQAFFAGRQRSAEYVRHVKERRGAAVNLNWIVGDMPADVVASLSLSVPRRQKAASNVDSGLVAGFLNGLMEMAAGMVTPDDIAWEEVRANAMHTGKLLPGSAPLRCSAPAHAAS